MGDHEFMTTPEVATLLRTKVPTVRSWRRLGTGPPYFRLNGKKVLYRRGEVEAWIRDHRDGDAR
jgi:excisionase family DNA binding protein